MSLDIRLTTVKRVFRRIPPALIPTDPTENLTSEERFQELLEILRASQNNRLWLAFLTNPMPGPAESPSSSLFAKRVHRSLKHAEQGHTPPGTTRRDNSMPLEVAQVLYNLAGALALTRCNARIIGIGDDRYGKNISWVLNQPWLDTRLRPVFFAAVKKLGGAGRS